MTEIVAYKALGGGQRKRTPRRVAEWLLEQLPNADVLWVAPTSVYRDLLPPERIWGQDRDAMTYSGPGPVICHPPCGPWSYLDGTGFMKPCQESRDHGLKALEFVHRYGGVVEQPATSLLFRHHGRLGAIYSYLNQGEYLSDGERLSLKPTVLYWWDVGRRT